MIHIENIGKKIWIKGRYSDKTPYIKIIDDFNPYFYVPSDNGSGLKSIDRVNLKKIELKHPSEVYNERNKYSHTYESDIPYTTRFIIDRINEIPYEPIRIAYLDIETQINPELGFPEPERASEAVTAICVYDNFLKKYLVFSWHPEINKSHKIVFEKGTKYFFTNEKDMFKKFVLYVKDCDPDIFTAYFGDSFDFPFIINRMKNIGINPSCLSPLNEIAEKRDSQRIKGRETLDFYWAYKKLKTEELESRSLNYLAKHENIGVEKIEYEGNLNDLWLNDFEKFIKYNIRDVEIIVEVDKKLGIIEFMDELRRLSKLTWYDGFNNGKIVDVYTLNFCKGKYVLPKREKFEQREKYKGGEVYTPVMGFHKKIITDDMKSLYPSIICSYNLSPETICENGSITTLTGLKVTDKYKGIFPQMMDKLFIERDEAKINRNKYKKGTSEYEKYDRKQYALKVLMNSFYGVLGNRYFRLYRYEIAETITAMARETLEHIRKTLDENGCEIIYADTDSNFFKIKNSENMQNEEIIKKAKELTEIVNKSFDVFAKNFGLKNHILKLQFERVYETLLFKENTKKRYAGRVIYEDGKDVDYLKIVGFDAIRSNTPSVARNFLKEFFRMIMYEEQKENIVNYCKKFYYDIISKKYSGIDIALPVGLGKQLSEYGKEGKSLPIYARASLYSNKYNKTFFRKGSKIKLLYVNNVPKNQEKTEVIAIDESVPENYEIDYENHAQKICIDKIKGITELLGWDAKVITGQTTLEKYMQKGD